MDFDANKYNQDKNHIRSIDGASEDVQTEKTILKYPQEKFDSFVCTSKIRKIKDNESPSTRDASGEVNMEANITADDIVQAGGIGARDDLNSFFPIASDLTDIEERLLDVEDYETSTLRQPQPLKGIENVKEHLASQEFQPEADTAVKQKENVIFASDRHVRKFKKHEGPLSEKASEEVIVDSAVDDPSIQETSRNIVKDIENIEENMELSSEVASDTVNMDASVTSDEVMRAGGFGAKDDISSFLPVATDHTDFEASLRGARDYEDSDEKVNRPGLGWNSKEE